MRQDWAKQWVPGQPTWDGGWEPVSEQTKQWKKQNQNYSVSQLTPFLKTYRLWDVSLTKEIKPSICMVWSQSDTHRDRLSWLAHVLWACPCSSTSCAHYLSSFLKWLWAWVICSLQKPFSLISADVWNTDSTPQVLVKRQGTVVWSSMEQNGNSKEETRVQSPGDGGWVARKTTCGKESQE